MLRILHFGALKSINPGVKAQLDYELAAAQKLEIEHTIIYFSNDEPTKSYMRKPLPLTGKFSSILPRKLKDYINLRVQAYSWLRENQHQFDAILIRYPLGDLVFPIYARQIKRFFTVHHTKEEPEICSHTGIIFKIQLILEKIQFKLINKKNLAFIGVTNEISDYENSRSRQTKPTIVYPNGVSQGRGIGEDKRGGKAKICFICNQETPWHGLSKIYDEILKSNRDDFELYLVGNITPDKALENDTRIQVKGFLEDQELANFLRAMDLSVGPFNLEAKNLREACPLKTRTSLQFGVPVLADYSDPCFSQEFPYFLKSEFALDKAIAFSLKMRAHSREKIAGLSHQAISKDVLFSHLVHEISKALVSGQKPIPKDYTQTKKS